jgi:hypothetical protein
MALIRKLKRILSEQFPPPSKFSIKDKKGIFGIVTSRRFQNMDTMDRQDFLEDVLVKQGLTPDELKQILIIAAVTPEEEAARAEMDCL